MSGVLKSVRTCSIRTCSLFFCCSNPKTLSRTGRLCILRVFWLKSPAVCFCLFTSGVHLCCSGTTHLKVRKKKKQAKKQTKQTIDIKTNRSSGLEAGPQSVLCTFALLHTHTHTHTNFTNTCFLGGGFASWNSFVLLVRRKRQPLTLSQPDLKK